jgi:hypothetical protein
VEQEDGVPERRPGEDVTRHHDQDADAAQRVYPDDPGARPRRPLRFGFAGGFQGM